MNIVLFGGSFDPIHLGHIRIAEQVASIYDATVLFIPAKIGVWKHESISIDHKLEMLKIALEGHPKLKIDEYEVRSSEPINYSIDTVKHFKEVYPNDNLYFLIGGDQAQSFYKWNGAKELSELVQILYYPRVTFEPSLDDIEKFHMIKIDKEVFPGISTDIRNLNNILLPPGVLKYILANDLYFVNKVKSFYSPKRYLHAISTAFTALEIAEANGLIDDVSYGRIFIAGYLHDLGKKLSDDESIQIISEHYPEYIRYPGYSYHQFTGAYLAQHEFGINDNEIIDAIMYHTTGKQNMTVIDKLIYAADKIEPTRGYNSKPLIDAMKKNLDEGFLYIVKKNNEYLVNRGERIDDNELAIAFNNQYKF